MCAQCDPNAISTDGISCIACAPGSQPNGEQTECVQCGTGRASTIGICTVCAAGKISSADRTGCEDCPMAHQTATIPELGCRCERGYFNASAIRPACHSGDYNPELAAPVPTDPYLVCLPCPSECIEDCQGDWVRVASGWSVRQEDTGELSILQCKYTDACPAGVVALDNSSACKPGHRAPLCGACAEHFSQNADGSCEDCKATSVSNNT